ncbi:MAG: methyltransferase [Bacteroidales bacterium]|jgi:tRNA1Val (adenine37-N6)-methyltransferase|nr:methyltransferase [Bacteroidales bacterium]MBP8678145.1 methyltransferase [Bacteroidales bacterium]MBP9978719.1 methyltransferase [Bacteroidales bacterium]
MGSFLFKQFSVRQEISAMKVNTDGVLLGAWCSLPQSVPLERPVRVLDVGTGTGVIALMVAQRLSSQFNNFNIVGIDPDAPSSEEAEYNFKASKWSNSLSSLPLSLKEFANTGSGCFDLIVSNPPYFINSLKAPAKRRSNARHSESLPFYELADCSANLLTPCGTLSVILPAEAGEFFVSAAALHGLSLYQICKVSTLSGEPEKRVLMEFSKTRDLGLKKSGLSVQESPGGTFSDDYRRLTADFYLKF